MQAATARSLQPWVALAGLGAVVSSVALSVAAPEFELVALLLALSVPAVVLLPRAWAVAAFLLLTLAAARPLPPAFGFHIQAQYLLLPALTAAALLLPPTRVRARSHRLLLLSAGLLVLVSLVAVTRDVLHPDGRLGVELADYAKWLAGLAFFLAAFRVAEAEGASIVANVGRVLLWAVPLLAALAALVAVASSGATESIQGRLNLPSVGPNRSGVILGVALIFALAPVVRGRLPPWRAALAAGLMVGLVLTGSREAVLALFAGLVTLVACVRTPTGYAILGFGAGALIVGAALAFALGAAQPGELTRGIKPYPEILPYLTVLGHRLPAWAAERVYFLVYGVDRFARSPLLGSGFDRSLSIPGIGPSGAPVQFTTAHNSYVSLLAQQGIFGLAALLSFVAAGLSVTFGAVRRTAGQGRAYEVAAAAACSVVLLAVDSLMDDALYYDATTMVMLSSIFALAIAVSRGPPLAHAAMMGGPERSDHPRLAGASGRAEPSP